MSFSMTLDSWWAGAPPQIRPSGDSVTFDLKISGNRSGSRLLLRCDENGNVWASIAKPKAASTAGDGSNG